ncbi:MAG TPA: hypothetical protein ENG98_00455 [Actinobacteria bacterium]|nr:hypothetical protein [Actinomycetota bacterium]
MGLITAETVRHGGIAPLVSPRPLQGGHFTAGLETPSLRNVAVEGIEVAQTITFSVRDRFWGTVEPAGWSTSFEDEDGSIRVDMGGRFTSDEIDLDAVVAVGTDPDGSLTYAVRATALRDFERARIGICVMHPITLSGRPLHVKTPDETYSTVFPLDLSPSRSISNIVALRHDIDDDREVVFEFEGDLFEFEDQRNWTDASYKTFCTPLSLPWPVSVKSGESIEQRVRISTIGRRRPLNTPTARSQSGIARAQVELGAPGGTIPSIGILAGPGSRELEIAKELGVSHVRITLDTRLKSLADDLAVAQQTLAGSDIGVEIEVVADDPADLSVLGAAIAQLGDRLRWFFVFDRKTQTTPEKYGQAIEDLRAIVGPFAGGGSGSNFGAINFNIDNIAFDSLDVLTFPMSPQVHYTDHFSFLTNLDAQSGVAANGSRIAGSRQLSIGPITLLPRKVGEPLASDPRSASLLAAAWTVASLSELMTSGADALTYHYVGDPGGIVDRDGAMNPTYHLLADLAGYSAARNLAVHVDSGQNRVAMIGLRRESEAMIVVANLESESVDVDMVLPPADVTVRTLDETTYDLARRDRAAFTNSSVPWNGEPLNLLPLAIATLGVTT